MVAKVALTVGAECYSYGDGKVCAVPTAAGTYWFVGRALTASSADGDVIEVETVQPQMVKVITATGAADVAAIITLLKLATAPCRVMFI
jgi:hypothetical protein